MSIRCSWLRRVDLWAVPALLTIVALNQIRLAHTACLTPWKGGGFGMFGSADDPGQRFVGVKGTAADGRDVDIKLTFPGGTLGSDVARRLACLPDQNLVQLVAQHMVSRSYVPLDLKRKSLLSRLRRDNPAAALPARRAEERPTYRIRTKNDPVGDNSQLVTLKRMDVQMWRLRFDPSTARVRCERMPFSATASHAAH